MRTPITNSALEVTLTRVRLQKYFNSANNDLSVALRLYEENTRLSEAFYTPLQCLEVCLRNQLHNQLQDRFGSDWFQSGAPGFNTTSQQMVSGALWELRNEPLPLDPNRLVAELKFAFWVGLLGPQYDATLWRQCLHKAFLPGGRKSRTVIHGRFNALRRFRNRVMHHEPIFQRPLQQFHDEIIQGIAWMCRETASWASHQSRFDTVSTTIANGAA